MFQENIFSLNLEVQITDKSFLLIITKQMTF